MHWLNFPLLMIMMYSGMRIYWADLPGAVRDRYRRLATVRVLARRGEQCARTRARLAKGIAFHLTFGWFFVLNGVAYMVFLARKGEWRHIVPDVQGIRDARKTVAHDLHLTKDKPVQGKYNPAQQVTYTLVIVISALLVASGFAIYKPGQLSWLEAAFGGYDSPGGSTSRRPSCCSDSSSSTSSRSHAPAGRTSRRSSPATGSPVATIPKSHRRLRSGRTWPTRDGTNRGRRGRRPTKGVRHDRQRQERGRGGTRTAPPRAHRRR